MKTNRLLILAAVVPWVVLAMVESSRSAPEPAAKEPLPDPLAMRYAQAQLRLAEVNLLRMQRANRRSANTIPADIVAEYEEDVEVAKTRLQAAQRGEADSPLSVWLRAALASAKSAERRWRSAVAANQVTAGAVEELDLQRLRLRAEVTRLQLERGKAVAGQPKEVQLQWEVSLLNDRLDHLEESVLRNPPVTRSYPNYWWFY